MARHKKRIDEKIKAWREKGKFPKPPMSVLFKIYPTSLNLKEMRKPFDMDYAAIARTAVKRFWDKSKKDAHSKG